jgi:6-pyruvoyl-tetrahydropterin synthase
VSWNIRIEGGNLSFSAAHFITLGDSSEPLHGHNYGISAEIASSELLPEGYVLDFGTVKADLRELIAEINHRFLLPLHNPHMQIRCSDSEWEIRLSDGARFVMPRSSVAALPLDNVTAERLAEYFAVRLAEIMRARGVTHLTAVTVGIAETEMQAAFYTWRAPPD